MRLTKRQLKRIIREEYTRLKRRGLIKEYGYELDDGLGNYPGDPGYSEMDTSYEDEAEVDQILEDAKAMGLQPGCSYDEFLTCCEDWYDGPKEHNITDAYEIFCRGRNR